MSCPCPTIDARECYLRSDQSAICDDDELELELDQNVCTCTCHAAHDGDAAAPGGDDTAPR
jgi:hypothetical protein